MSEDVDGFVVETRTHLPTAPSVTSAAASEVYQRPLQAPLAPTLPATPYVSDLLDRRTLTSVFVGPGVSNDTTLETYTYDGLSRVVTAQDDDTSVTLSLIPIFEPTRPY